jgi:hypothetical protein
LYSNIINQLVTLTSYFDLAHQITSCNARISVEAIPIDFHEKEIFGEFKFLAKGDQVFIPKVPVPHFLF